MAANTALKLQQSPLRAPLPGYWKLAPERALTLNPDDAGILRVAQGQVWATLDGPHQGPANDWGDMVLQAGEQLRLLPGQQVVVESFGDAVNQPVYFSWEPASSISQAVTTDEADWRDAWARPALKGDDEIMVSIRALARFLARLARGLRYLVAGKGRVLSHYESNQP